MKIPIMSVKLKMPQPRKNYIVRQSLFDTLTQLKEYKLTIVKAGAGSGKTTLLSTFITERNMENVKWITLDESTNDPFIFWNYFIESIKDFIGDAKSDFQTFFDSNMQKENLIQILSFLVNCLNVEQEINIVLDDFHEINDSFLISTIDYFIKNMPDSIHLILLTREMPNIYLGALGIDGKLLIFEETDIRLSKDEGMQFLVDTLRINKKKELLNAMVEASEGWIGGLQLLALASKDKNESEIRTFGVTNKLLEDYITKEIFMYLTNHEQEFLVYTSILQYFSESICRKYLPNVNFQEMIHSILQKNLFVISIDENEAVYRYHAILSEYLKGRFKKLDEINKEKAHNLAANIFKETSEYEQCLYHLFEIDEYDEAMEIILKMPQTSLTFSYLVKVPMEEISKNKDFAYQYFFYHYASLDSEKCEKIYNFIKDNMQEDDTFDAFKHSDMFFSDKWDLDKIKISTIEQIESLPLNPVTSAFLLIKEAYFLFAASEYQEAMKYLDSAEQVYKKSSNYYIKYYILSIKAQIYEDIGNLNGCHIVYRDIKTMISKYKAGACSYYIGLAGVYIKQLALDKAFETLEKAKEQMPYEAVPVERAYKYTLAEYYYITGNYEKTDEILAEMLELEIFQNIYFSARLLRYPICRNKNGELAEKFLNDYEKAGQAYRNMDCELLYAIILYESKQIEKSIKVLQQIISIARKKQNTLKIVEGDLLKVHILLDTDGQQRDIQNLFIEAISYGTENCIALPFFFENNTVNRVMKAMGAEIKSKLSKEELEFLISIQNIDTKRGIKHIQNSCNDLSEREKEVLNELAKGSTNKQIAENLCISLATVKSHIINIYGKLEVNNRVSAVNKGIK